MQSCNGPLPAKQPEVAMSLDTQAQFANALGDPRRDMPDGLTAWNGRHPARRFDVYRNNVAMALTGALSARFPVTVEIVGEAFFTAMALEFVRCHPPLSPLLLAYGDDFAAFVVEFEPARELTYLPDVIRLEAARSMAYNAGDSMPLDGAELATVAPEHLAGVIIRPHPSMSVLRFTTPAVTIWAMNAGELELAPIDDWRGEDAMIVRPQMIVNIHRLPPGGATFVTALAEGQTLGTAAVAAINEAPDFDLSTNLAGILQSGAFTAII